MRFEAVFKGTYAHQITEQLQQINSEDELKRLIAKDISDKYRFFDSDAGDVLKITDDLVGLAAGTVAGTLSYPGTRDNTLKQSISYLRNNSGLYMIFYKVYSVWGTEGEEKLLKHLKVIYEREYKPTAYKKAEIRHWWKKHGEELRRQQVEDDLQVDDDLQGKNKLEVEDFFIRIPAYLI